MAIQGVWVFLFRGQEAKKKKLVFRYKSDVVKGSVRFINFKDSHSYITHTGGSAGEESEPPGKPGTTKGHDKESNLVWSQEWMVVPFTKTGKCKKI